MNTDFYEQFHVYVKKQGLWVYWSVYDFQQRIFSMYKVTLSPDHVARIYCTETYYLVVKARLKAYFSTQDLSHVAGDAEAGYKLLKVSLLSSF